MIPAAGRVEQGVRAVAIGAGVGRHRAVRVRGAGQAAVGRRQRDRALHAVRGDRDLARVHLLAVQRLVVVAHLAEPGLVVGQNLVRIRIVVAVLGRHQAVVMDLIVLGAVIALHLGQQRERADLLGRLEAEVVLDRSAHLIQAVLLVLVHQLLQRDQRVHQVDRAAGLDVEGGIEAVAELADVLAPVQAVRFEERAHDRHVVLAPDIVLDVVGRGQAVDRHLVVDAELIDQFFVGFQLAVVWREELLAQAMIVAVEEHALQDLRVGDEVHADRGRLARAAGDPVLLAVQFHRLPDTRRGLEAAADGDRAGIFEGHAFGAVLLHEELDADLVVHEGRVAGARLDGLDRGRHEVVRELVIVHDGEGRLRALQALAGDEDQLFECVAFRLAVAVQAAHAQVVEGVGGEHATDDAGRSERVDAGELHAVHLEQLEHLVICDAARGLVLLVPGEENLSHAAGRHARDRVLVDDREVDQAGHLQRFLEGARLLVGDPLQHLGDISVFLLLLRVFGDALEAPGLPGIVGDPGLKAFDHQADSLVVVHAVHASDAVAIRTSGNLVLALVADLDQAIEAVGQRVVVVDDLTALGKREARVEHADDRLHHLFFEVILGHHHLVDVAQFLDRLAFPIVGHLDQCRDFFRPDAELAGDRDDVAEVFGDVAAAGAELGFITGCCGAALLRCLVELVALRQEEGVRQVGHGERAAVVIGLAHDDLLAGPDHGGHVAEGCLEALRPPDHGNLVLPFDPLA